MPLIREITGGDKFTNGTFTMAIHDLTHMHPTTTISGSTFRLLTVCVTLTKVFVLERSGLEETELIAEGLRMSQFFLIEREVSVEGLVGVYFVRPSLTDPLMAAVVEHYRYDPSGCRLVTDVHGSGEPLVDGVWLLQKEGLALEESPFVTLLRTLVNAQSGFVMWCSDDYREIETVHTWPELMRTFRDQTCGQPADIWLHFEPPARKVAENG